MSGPNEWKYCPNICDRALSAADDIRCRGGVCKCRYRVSIIPALICLHNKYVLWAGFVFHSGIPISASTLYIAQ